MKIVNMATNDPIENILDRFEFEKVYAVMRFLGWKWVQNDGMDYPSVKQMRARAKYLLNKAYDESMNNDEDETISTGGFEASYIRKGFGAAQSEGIFILRFVIETKDNEE